MAILVTLAALGGLFGIVYPLFSLALARCAGDTRPASVIFKEW